MVEKTGCQPSRQDNARGVAGRRKMETPLMTTRETAKYLRVHEMTIYRWLKSGALPGIRIGGRWRVHKSTLEKFLIFSKEPEK